MAAPSDRNARIALAKGWEWTEETTLIWGNFGEMQAMRSHWHDPTGKPAMCPDYVGTLAGVAGLLRELNEREDVIKSYSLYWSQPERRWVLIEEEALLGNQTAFFWSPEDRPGDCVADAWLSEHGKGMIDASTEA